MHSLKDKTKSELIAEIERLRGIENTMHPIEKLVPDLRSIIQKIPNTFISVFNHDLRLEFTFAHELASQAKASSAFLLQSPEEIYGIHGSMIREKIQKSFKGKDEHFELHISGNYYHYKTSPLPSSSGLISAVALIAVKSRTTEHANNERDEKFRALYNYGPLCYQSLKDDGTLKDVNPTWLSTLGYNREEIIGKYYGDLLHPDWKEGFKNNFAKFAKQGYIHNVEFKVRHKNGQYKYINLEGCAGYHADGRFKQTYCVFQDITERKQAEDNFNETNTLNKAIIANVHEGIVVYDTSLKIKLWNPFMQKLTSYSVDAVLNKTAEKAFSPAIKKELLSRLKLTLKTQRSHTSIIHYDQKHTGKKIWLSDQSSPLKNDKGELIGVIGIVRDITHKIEAEQALRASEEKFRAIFEQSPIAIELFDANGHFVEINKKTMDMFGVENKQQLINYNLWSDPHLSKEQIQDLKNGNAVKLSTNFDFDLVNQHKLYPTTRSGKIYLDMFALPLINERTESYYLVQIIETTEQKQILHKLQKRNQFIETMVNNLPIGFAVQNKVNGEQIYMNKQYKEIYGWSKSAPNKAADFFEMVFPDDANDDDEKTKPNWATAEGQNRILKNLKIKTPNGELRYLDVSNIPLSNQQLTISTVQDVTKSRLTQEELLNHRLHLEELVSERTQALAEKTLKLEKSQRALTYLLEDVNAIRKQLEHSNTKLIQANEELESFSYSVSHDLRAPLRAINGYSKILLEDYILELDDEAKRLFSVIINNTENMRQLIDDILALSRLGRKELKIQSIDVVQLVQNIIIEVQQEEKNRDIVFEIENLPKIKGDQGMIKQLFINLISNAVKFTRHRSRALIHIGTKVDEQQTIFFVKDNGAGFDMRYVKKIFEVFQRLHTAEQFEGTGIGLALVQRIVRKHNGKIWAESETNEGTTLFFQLKQDI